MGTLDRLTRNGESEGARHAAAADRDGARERDHVGPECRDRAGAADDPPRVQRLVHGARVDRDRLPACVLGAADRCRSAGGRVRPGPAADVGDPALRSRLGAGCAGRGRDAPDRLADRRRRGGGGADAGVAGDCHECVHRHPARSRRRDLGRGDGAVLRHRSRDRRRLHPGAVVAVDPVAERDRRRVDPAGRTAGGRVLRREREPAHRLHGRRAFCARARSDHAGAQRGADTVGVRVGQIRPRAGRQGSCCCSASSWSSGGSTTR